MALSEENMSADAITEIRDILSRDLGGGIIHRRPITLTLNDICFIFGIEYKDPDNQDTFSDAVDWFTAKIATWAELGSIHVRWYNRSITLFPTPAPT